MPNYTVSGRVLSSNGSPRAGLNITVYERQSLTTDIIKASTTTDPEGRIVASWAAANAPRRHRGTSLFAGEHLAKDLRRLDKAHMERDLREYELRKSISLAQLDPAALYHLQS